ncbi:MAG: hypothetical protein JWL86_197 [Rhizobium sp.]|nr:hypothetical protein [Rhizobium sp.]
MSWDIAFPDTIAVPRGKAIATLRDAGAYITGLPKDQHDASVWQTAMECLLLVADKGGPPEFARLALEQAIRSKGNPVYRSP